MVNLIVVYIIANSVNDQEYDNFHVFKREIVSLSHKCVIFFVGNMSKFFDCCTNTECSGAQFDNDFVAPIAYKESSSSESDENNDEKHGHKTIEMETIMIGGGGIAALACVLFVISRCTRKKKQPPVSVRFIPTFLSFFLFFDEDCISILLLIGLTC